MGLIKRILAVFFVFVFAAGLFGCSKIGAPATTEELLVRYVANENVGNFDAKVNVDLSVNALGVRAVVPVKADLRVANNVAHGTIEVDLSSLNTRNYTMEIYAELHGLGRVIALGKQSCEDAGEYVAAAGSSHAGVACGVKEDVA